MKKVYICSPYRGSIEENSSNAKKYCKQAILNGCLPIAPHVYFTQFLDDNNESERSAGMSCGLQLLSECEEIWVFGNEITNGMKVEIEYANVNNIPIKFMG